MNLITTQMEELKWKNFPYICRLKDQKNENFYTRRNKIFHTPKTENVIFLQELDYKLQICWKLEVLISVKQQKTTRVFFLGVGGWL